MLAILKELLQSLVKIGSIKLSILIVLLIGLIFGIRMIFKKKKNTKEK